jgi:DNA-binding NarL/FixJ family response regulator
VLKTGNIQVDSTRPSWHIANQTMKKIRILLADDHLLIRAGVRALLDSLKDFQVVAECADGLEALAGIRSLQPDIALLDIAMPGLNGIEVSKAVRQFDPNIRILVLSGFGHQEIVEQAFAAGVNGYLLKDFLLAELEQALQAVLAGIAFLSPKIQGSLNQSDLNAEVMPASGLTGRQTEILRLVASGQTTKEIARHLGISPKTVEFHRGKLMEKLAVHDVTALTRYAIRAGIIT